MAEYMVYVLANSDNNRTYVGCTNNAVRRLRQHNQEITGGAKATKCSRTWKYMVQAKGFKSKSDALSFEWHCKRTKGSKGRTPLERRRYMLKVLVEQPRWGNVVIIQQAPPPPPP